MEHLQQLRSLENLLKKAFARYTLLQDTITITSAAQGALHYGITLNETTPTLIIKTGSGYYAAILSGNSKISFKKLKESLNVSEAMLADPATVFALTGAKIGYISLINHGIKTIIDNNVLNNKDCFGGCGVPSYTLRINTEDLIKITHAEIFDFTELKS